VFNLALDTDELDDRNYKLQFLPYKTDRRLSEFDGIITFQRLYESYKSRSNYTDSWTEHNCDRNELDKREKEAEILIRNGGFIVFILHQPFRDHIYQSHRSCDYRDTDLAKRFLNWSRLNRNDFEKRYTGVKCVRDEFLRFFQLYGAAWSSFSHYGSLSWKELAMIGSNTASMIIVAFLIAAPFSLLVKNRKAPLYPVMD